MKITEVALRRPATVIVLTLSLVLFGILGMRGMGGQRTPDVDFPIVAVTTTMRGASAAVMDNDVTDIIEEKLSTISGIESISSSSYEGRATTVVQFDLGRDIDAAAADVRDRVNLAIPEL
ncbi:MAG: efflux RND transporter permease subunit, partial [Synergistaceae bacterium]|nr:efflux RND transporter permease subunit [Synergistaceae bacterium]